MALTHLDLDNITGIITIFVASLTILGALVVVVRTILLLRRDATAVELGVSRSSEGSTGARKLRRVLVVCLLTSDLLIAISVIGPAAIGLAGKEASEKQCEAQGFLLATALWWQYGFSFCIALTTLIGLRYPLSRWKSTAEERIAEIVVVVLLVGGVQAMIWKFDHGFEEWHDLCLYGSPQHVGDEIMQFLPRLLSSLMTAACYIPLLFFLRRPDPGALYLSPRPTSAISFSPSTETLPPWERLSFPNFAILEKGSYSFSPKLDTFAEELPSEEASQSDTPTKPKRFSAPLRPKSGTLLGLPGVSRLHGSRPSTAPSLKTVLPAPEATAADDEEVSISTFPLPRSSEDNTRQPDPSDPQIPPSAPKSRPKPDLSVDTRKSNRARFEEGIPSPLSPIAQSILNGMSPTSASIAIPLSAVGRQRSNTIPASLDLEVSFSTMLSYVPPAPIPTSISAPLMNAAWSSHSRSSSNASTVIGREEVRSRSGTPDVKDSGRSMASEINRRTLKFLIWFPIAHGVIFFFVLIRAILLGCTHRTQTVPIALLTLGMIMIQGLFDILTFGLVERRFRDAIADASAHPDDSISLVAATRVTRWRRLGGEWWARKLLARN